jgi:membrane-bound lytic murein transglycosylase D
MNRSWPVHAFVVWCVFFAAANALCQTNPVALAAAAGTVEASKPSNATSADLYSDADIPLRMQDVMRNSQLKYQEGSNLIKAGESARARAAFNSAVDLLLQSDYDLNSTPILNRFFQDLICRIQQDEARYLRPPDEVEEKPEAAVVDELEKVNLIPIKVDPSLQDAVATDLANTRYDIPVVLNDKVLKALDFWLNRGRKFFTDGLVRSGRYRDMIERIFREESIPLDVMYLAQVESLFKTNAVSRAKARGIWQFERGTAIRYDLKVNSYVDERSDPEKSTRAAARYLSDLYEMFNDWSLVLAAYNWGEGKVQRLMDKCGLNDFWKMTALRRRNFPKETQNHVPLIMASIILAHNPEKYGLPKELEPPQAYEQLAVTKPIDLRAVARILNITLEELKQLNPSLRGLSTPANYTDFQLKIPPGSNQPEISQKIAALPAVKFRPPPESPGRHRIQSGDTLSSIAARHHVSVAALVSANKGISPKSLQIGKWIQIPEPRTTSASSRSRSTAISSPRIRSSVPSSTKGAKKPAVRAAQGGKRPSPSVTKASPAKAKAAQAPKQVASK